MDSELQGNHRYKQDVLQPYSSAPGSDRLININVCHFNIGSVFKIKAVEYQCIYVGIQHLNPCLLAVAKLCQYYLICTYELPVGHVTDY